MSCLDIEPHGDMLVVRLAHPPVNAWSHALRAELAAALDRIEGDEQARAAVLICAARTFPAGSDIREFDRPPQAPELRDVVARIEASRKLMVAAIHGARRPRVPPRSTPAAHCRPTAG